MKSLSDWKKKCSKEQFPAGTVYQELTYIMGLKATTLTTAGLPIPAHMLVRPLFALKVNRLTIRASMGSAPSWLHG
ncbi:MAG: hypothetical protein KDE51_07645 [Anaerolineales bacterium]|nr:hypothetical protein [Anaerolineales bacterium]